MNPVSAKHEEPNAITMAEFLAAPAAAIQKAIDTGEVVVVNEKGEQAIRFSTQKEALDLS